MGESEREKKVTRESKVSFVLSDGIKSTGKISSQTKKKKTNNLDSRKMSAYKMWKVRYRLQQMAFRWNIEYICNWNCHKNSAYRFRKCNIRLNLIPYPKWKKSAAGVIWNYMWNKNGQANEDGSKCVRERWRWERKNVRTKTQKREKERREHIF